MPFLIVKTFLQGLCTALSIWRAKPLLYSIDPSPTEQLSLSRNRAIWVENIGLNGGIFLGGMSFVEYIVFPRFQNVGQISLLANFMYYCLWLTPLWCLCIVTNGNLVGEMAKHSFNLLKRTDQTKPSNTKSGSAFSAVARKAGDILYDSFVVYTLFGLCGAVDFIVLAIPWICHRAADACAFAGSTPMEHVFRTHLSVWLPTVGMVVSFVHYCWLYSFWAFNPRWKLEGLTVVQRLKKIECDWSYYFGYGVPLALFTTWNSFFYNIAIYALLFPLLVMVATTANTATTSTPMKGSIVPHIPIFRLSHAGFNVLIGCCKTKKNKRT